MGKVNSLAGGRGYVTEPNRTPARGGRLGGPGQVVVDQWIVVVKRGAVKYAHIEYANPNTPPVKTKHSAGHRAGVNQILSLANLLGTRVIVLAPFLKRVLTTNYYQRINASLIDSL